MPANSKMLEENNIITSAFDREREEDGMAEFRCRRDY